MSQKAQSQKAQDFYANRDLNRLKRSFWSLLWVAPWSGAMIYPVETPAETKVLAQSLPAAINLTARANQFYSFPRLIYTGTTQDQVRASSPRYYFTLEFPPSAGAALETIVFQQTEGLPIELDPTEVIAFQGQRRHRGVSLPVEAFDVAPTDPPGLKLRFNPPIAPGQTITIGVRSIQNPFQDGIYLYKLLAYPEGNDTEGYTLGTARFHFYDVDSNTESFSK